MLPTITEELREQAAEQLAKNDPRLAPIIARAGLCRIEPHRDYYRELVESIVGQQLSVKAAASIRTRFLALFGGEFPSPEAILEKTIEELRSAGLSGAKAKYIQDLAAHVLDGSVQFDHLDSLSDAEVIAELTVVKGIGVWTAHMFLMFCMGRVDVLAVGDLGIRNGIQKLYGFDHLPLPAEIEALANANGWHPFATIACWYIWFSLDNKPM